MAHTHISAFIRDPRHAAHFARLAAAQQAAQHSPRAPVAAAPPVPIPPPAPRVTTPTDAPPPLRRHVPVQQSLPLTTPPTPAAARRFGALFLGGLALAFLTPAVLFAIHAASRGQSIGSAFGTGVFLMVVYAIIAYNLNALCTDPPTRRRR